MKSSYKSQQGYSFYSVLFVILVGGIFFSVGFKLYPAYIDYMTIDTVLTNVIEDKEEVSKNPRLIQTNLEKKWSINQITLPSKKAIAIRRKSGELLISLDYEVRVPMFFNVDAMVKFEKQYEAIIP